MKTSQSHDTIRSRVTYKLLTFNKLNRQKCIIANENQEHFGSNYPNLRIQSVQKENQTWYQVGLKF